MFKSVNDIFQHLGLSKNFVYSKMKEYIFWK